MIHGLYAAARIPSSRCICTFERTFEEENDFLISRIRSFHVRYIFRSLLSSFFFFFLLILFFFLFPFPPLSPSIFVSALWKGEGGGNWTRFGNFFDTRWKILKIVLDWPLQSRLSRRDVNLWPYYPTSERNCGNNARETVGPSNILLTNRAAMLLLSLYREMELYQLRFSRWSSFYVSLSFFFFFFFVS